MDTVTARLALAQSVSDAGIPLISAMGIGNKTDPSALHVSLIEQTSVCLLARIMRNECIMHGITGLKAVWSSEKPPSPLEKLPIPMEKDPPFMRRRDAPGSFAFLPAAAGLLLASRVVLELLDSSHHTI